VGFYYHGVKIPFWKRNGPNICSGNWKNSGLQSVNRKYVPEFQNTWFWKFPVYGKK